MIYKQIKPDPALAPYVDAFWTATSDQKKAVTEKILPDGCVDIILSMGDDCKTDNSSFNIRNEKAYLVGAMRHFKIIEMNPETKLFGIRFKPAGFSAFYKFSSLHEITDQTVELEKKFSPDLKDIVSNSTEYLNQFFLKKLSQPKHILLPIVADVENHKGQISVMLLAKRHFITVRRLERLFKQHVGMSPKEFINFMRFQSVLPIVQHRSSERSLVDIAFEYGYYDHSHLTNEVKRYTGAAPSQF